MNTTRANLVAVLSRVLPLLEAKTVAYYQRVLDKDVRDLYAGKLDQAAFVDDMVRLIDQQFDRAWNEGMRDNDLDPRRDMKPEWERVLDERKLKELDYVEQYARDILTARENGDPVDPLRARVELWALRYDEVVDLSRITTRPGDRFKWNLGRTEQHCETCAKLNGIVATGEQWKASGYHPKGAPNDQLECGGWRCDCTLDPTDEPLTQGGIPGG